MLTLNRHINEIFLRDLIRIVVMFRIFEVDEAPFLEPDDPNPLGLRLKARGVVFFDTSVNASPAADTPRKVKTITPERIGDRLLNTHLKFLPIFIEVSCLQSGNEGFLLIIRHFKKMFLQEVLHLFLRARGKERESEA